MKNPLKNVWVNFIAMLIVAVAAINWGLVGWFDFNLLSYFMSGLLLKIVYGIVGLLGIYGLISAGIYISKKA